MSKLEDYTIEELQRITRAALNKASILSTLNPELEPFFGAIGALHQRLLKLEGSKESV